MEISGVQVNDGFSVIAVQNNTIAKLKQDIAGSKFCIESIGDKDVLFYTGFPTYDNLRACYNNQESEINNLMYVHGKHRQGCWPWTKSSLNEFFLALACLRQGLFERIWQIVSKFLFLQCVISSVLGFIYVSEI